MRIGITGCAGFLGSHLVDRLLAREHEVVGIDNLSMGRMKNIEHNLDHRRFTFRKADVRDAEAMDELLGGLNVIVHLAAFKIPRYGEALDTLLINNLGAHNVLETARKSGCKVVLASTSDVYGKNPDLPFREDGDLVIGPSTVARWSYAVSKLFDEHLSFAYQDKYGIPVVNLRFFGSYGPRHHLSWWGGPQSVFISQVLSEEEITIHGDGRQTRSFTYVSDTVDGIVAATEKEAANGQIFNIGSNQEISILDLARLIHRLCATGRPLRLKFTPYESLSGRKYEDVRRRIPDNRKARELLGVVPEVSLEEGLMRTIRWQRETMQPALESAGSVSAGKAGGGT
jgi:UDP-glucose 4-epimerase